jgi:hypothetical protein
MAKDRANNAKTPKEDKNGGKADDGRVKRSDNKNKLRKL